MQGMKVLIVDDSIILVQVLKAAVTKLGFVVAGTAGSGAEAVSEYRDLLPDLVLMDVTMPGMDGIDATRMITQEFPDARIIMVTAVGQEQMVVDALAAGAAGYVLKPVQASKLSEAITGILKRKPGVSW